MWRTPAVKKNAGSPTTGDPLRDMRLSVVVMILCSYVPCHAQSSDTLVHHHRLKCIGIFASGGVGVPQYYSDKYFEFLAKEFFSPADGSPVANNNPIEEEADIQNKVSPSILSRDTPYPAPVLTLGAVFRPANAMSPKIDHSLTLGYMRSKGHLTSRASYWETYSLSWYASLTDTIRNEFTQNAFSLGYRLRWTYSRVWFSIGAGVSYNKVKVDQEGTSYVVAEKFYEIGPNVPYSRVQPYASRGEATFWSFPLVVGGGLRFRTGRILLLPAFYLTAYLDQEYLLPRAGLEVQYEFK